MQALQSLPHHLFILLLLLTAASVQPPALWLSVVLNSPLRFKTHRLLVKCLLEFTFSHLQHLKLTALINSSECLFNTTVSFDSYCTDAQHDLKNFCLC